MGPPLEFDQSMGVQSAGQYMQQQRGANSFMNYPMQGGSFHGGLTHGSNNPELTNDEEMQVHMMELQQKFQKIRE
jgi:hypothetical protein